jgi:protocatechuate 3,4-dioxygenase beta subunit
MNRKEFLKGLGLAGIGITTLSSSKSLAESQSEVVIEEGGACTLIPTETAGPFPLDLTANNFYFRKNITESKPGIPFNLKLKIVGNGNCLPMPNLRVNIWHCSNDGLYSGYDNNMNAGQAGKTYLRGYQLTDSNGEVEFNTIFPGWYNGRICHIHFQVFVNSAYSAISQLTFDITKKNALYAANPSLYRGIDPTALSSDNVFSDGYTYQIASLTPNNTGGYDSYLEVTIKGSGTTATGHLEKENAKQFVMGQNFPNPFVDEVTIPLSMLKSGKVNLDLYDVNGKKVANIINETLNIGDHNVKLNFKTMGIPPANYAYQLEVSNEDGIFRDCKLMSNIQ